MGPPQGSTTETNTGATTGRAFTVQLAELAADLGRIRRRLNGDEYGSHLVDRAAGRVHTIDALLWPTAAELVATGDTPHAALATVDARTRQLASLLGEAAR